MPQVEFYPLRAGGELVRKTMNRMLNTKQYKPGMKHRSRRGMVLLAVLFIVMAVVMVSLGILYRADMAAVGGQNYALHTQADYIAWAGLEHARALILADPAVPTNSFNKAPFTLDEDALFYYLLTIDPNTASIDPNSSPWQYSIECEVYYNKDETPRSRSELTASVLYDPNTVDGPKAWFSTIQRQ